MKSGLPPAARAILARSSSGDPLRDQLVDVLVAQRLEPQRHRPGGAALGQLRAAPCRAAGSGRREERSATCSIRSRNVCSPHWMSSKTTTSGRSAAACSSVLRKAQAISSADVAASVSPSSERIAAAAASSEGSSVELLQHLDHRPVGDPLPVGEAAAADDRRLDRGQKLRGQPRLADARVADDRDQLAALLGLHTLPRLPEERELALASDEQRLVPPLRRLAHAQEPVGRDRLGLALQLERLDRLDLDCVAGERERRRSDQHLARLGRLLQPRRDVDRVAGRQPLLGAGHDLARHHADPPLQPELGQRVAHLDRRPQSAQRVVLVQHRHAEHRHHGVADELLHAAAVALDDRLHPLEVAGEQRPQPLGIERLAEGGRAGQVAEQNRHRLALLLRPRGRSGEREATLLAELGALAVRVPTARTNQHAYETRPHPHPRQPRPRLAEALLTRLGHLLLGLPRAKGTTGARLPAAPASSVEDGTGRAERGRVRSR